MSETDEYSFQGGTGAPPAIGVSRCRRSKFFAVALAALLWGSCIVSPDSAAAERQHCKLENGSVLLVEQEYGNGPLSKLCRQAEQALRANCKFGAGFSDKVFVLCAVNQDGSFSRIAADDIAKYDPAISALACEKVKALNLKSPGKDPVPLVISLSNQPELNIVYVSGMNYDTYLRIEVAVCLRPTRLL